MSVACRAPRLSHARRRLPRLESLEGRALLATTPVGPGLGFPPPATEVALHPQPEGGGPFAESGASSGLAQDATERPTPWRISTAFPWRVAAWRLPELERPPAAPLLLEPGGPRAGIDSAVMFPRLRELRLEGHVAPGEGIDFFGLEIGPGTRSFDVSYLRLEDEAWGGPVRVWLLDAGGNVIDSWTLDPSFDGLELQMLALVRPDPTVIYFGIEAAWGEGSGAGGAGYALEIRRGGGMGASPFVFPTSSPISTGPPSTGGDSPGGFAEGADPGASLGQGLPGAVAGPSIGFGPPDASGGGSGSSFLEVVAPGAIGLGRGVPRPLPTQAAASAGGLLAAGPDVRGDSGSPARVTRFDDFADPILLAVEPVLPADPEGTEGGGPSGTPRRGVPASGAGREASGIAMASPTATPPIRLAGVGGGSLPLLVAGLRLAWGGPVASAPGLGPDAPAEVAEELASIAAIPPLGPIEPRSPALPPVPRTDPEAEPTRPRVLRTALIGAAALAVGLILPDLAADRPCLRHRRARPLRPWRRLTRS
ncbi:hypothetical protein [Tautonia plasticadhaerens]|uniref:Uncharacterized protein n=1 Tax=Tautonia plasticadhaerens TaxID=2527974 RepID=A0A518GWI4_9BACT|nr:hypothetical protein [Tautonia plasticadhaerens]QDV32955.1 hypothetical protein ElP_07970 [Tautonia plasticadhaerens]